MNCIIVDDDKLSIKVLEEYLIKTEGIDNLGSFCNGVDAANFLSKNEEVDLVFLDIEMPEMNGIDFLSSLGSLPQIIITSSKEKYALSSYDFDVTDYLLKPISYSRFYKSIEKAKKRFSLSVFKLDGKDEIFIKKGSNLIKLRFNDILWIEALENYVILNTRKDKYTIHFTMKSIEKKLPSPIFSRVHRSFIVNTKSISIIRDNALEITHGRHNETIPIGKSYKENLLRDINLMTK